MSKIVIDDDSTTKKKLKHSNTPSDKGELPTEHPIILFLADKNHRIRTLGKKVFALARAAKKVSLVEKIDATRIKRNFAYFIFQNGTECLENLMKKGKAVLEHMFDNHEYCGKWCKAKNLTKKEKEEKGFIFRDKNSEIGKAIYENLKEALDPFLSKESLLEILHQCSINKCEAMNAVIA